MINNSTEWQNTIEKFRTKKILSLFRFTIKCKATAWQEQKYKTFNKNDSLQTGNFGQGL